MRFTFQAAVLTLAASFAFDAAAKPFAYVPNQGSNTVSVIDIASDSIVTNLRAGISPVRVAIHPNNLKAYVANIGSDRVTVINTTNNSVGRTIVVGDSPAEILVSPDGAQVWTPNAQGSNVTVVSTLTETVLTNLPAGFNCRAIVWVTNSIGNRVYVANQGNATVSIYNPANLTTDRVLNVGSGTRRMAVTPDGSRVYTANYNTDNVSVIDAITRTVMATIPVGDAPRGVTVSPDGTEVWVTNLQDNTVSIISVANNTVVATLPAGILPWTIVFNRAGTRAYVLNSGNNNVSVYDVATRTQIKTVPVGSGCFWAEFSSDDSRLYVTNPNDGTVSLIDAINNVNVGTLVTGESAWVIAIQADAPPQITGVVPDQVNAGSIVQMNLTGSNLRRGATPSLQPAVAGVTFTNISVASTSNQMTFTMSVAANAPTGSANLRVRNIDGTSAIATGAVTILPAAPQPPPGITGFNPTQVAAGATTGFTITGSNFQAGATVSIAGGPAGLSIVSPITIGATTITGQVAAAVNAPAGPHDVIVTNPDTKSDTEPDAFGVTPAPAPTLLSARPATVTAGTTTNLLVFGTSFFPGLTVEPQPASFGISVTNASYLTSTSLTVTVSLAVNAATGPQGFRVTNLDGQFASSANLYTVQMAPAPTIVNLVPWEVTAGTTRSMTLTGTGFLPGITVTPVPVDPGLTIANVQLAGSTTLLFDLVMAQSVPAGQYGFTVRNLDNQSATANPMLAINAYAPPIVNSASPVSIVQGETWPMTILGSRFQTGATVAVAPTNSRVTLTDVQIANTNTITLTINVATNATTGSFGFTVTNPDALSGTGNNLFSIVPLPALAATACAPGTVARGVTTNVTVFGRGFVPASTVSFGGMGPKISVLSKTYINSTNLNVRISVPSNAKTGGKSVTVSRPGSSSVTLNNGLTVN